MLPSTVVPPIVGITGAGIAGPVMAMFLMTQGYDCVIFERTTRDSAGGISFVLQPNGMKVLRSIPGLLEKALETGVLVSSHEHVSIRGSETDMLAAFDLPRGAAESLTGVKDGVVCCVSRVKFHKMLVDEAERRGAKIHFDKGVEEVIRASDSQVTVRFLDETAVNVSFVIGADGLHSRTRTSLFGKQPSQFTGLIQMGGHSEVEIGPQAGGKKIKTLYGDGFAVIAYPISSSTWSWALTLREDEAKETWKAMSEADQDAVRRGPYSELPDGWGSMIKNTSKITKYGLYDRPELSTWHKGRIVLIGDAAHPTSPHLGQGANQAFEDVFHLDRLLRLFNPPSESEITPEPSLQTLERAFSKLAELRIPRTAELVRGARAQGELRVQEGERDCASRDEKVRHLYSQEISTEAIKNTWTKGFAEEADFS